jgi:hypothetical protein
MELLNKIKTGNIYTRKSGERCLVQSIETVSYKNNNIDYNIHFLLQPTNIYLTRKTEFIKDFLRIFH